MSNLLSIGSKCAPPVQPERPVAVGRQPRIGEATLSSKSDLQYRRIAAPALNVNNAPIASQTYPVES